MDVFEAKVRRVGSSLGLLIPKEIIEGEKIKELQTVKVAIIKKDLAAIDKAFGSMKGLGPFVRENDDREF